jgi:predicted PurR-regulated permease PerM
MNSDNNSPINQGDIPQQIPVEAETTTASATIKEADVACASDVGTLASHKIVVAFFFFILTVILFLSFQILRPFLEILIVAAAAANLSYPVFKWITRRFGGRSNIGAVLTLLLLVVIAVIPITIYSSILSREAVNLTKGLNAATIQEHFQTAVKRFLPGEFDLNAFIEERFGPEGILGSKYFKESVNRIAGAANKIVQGFISGIATAFLSFLLFFLFLFFLLRDGEALGKELMSLSPLEDKDDREIFTHLSKTIRGTLIGGVLVPIIQGILAMIGFTIFGLPSPVLWGSMVIIGAVIPFVGSAIIWIPATVYLALTAATWQWVGLLLYCGIIISTADNFIKPIILKETANFHPLFAFISVLGGLAAFGVFGFILGPIVASLLLSLIRIYKYEVLKQTAGLK